LNEVVDSAVDNILCTAHVTNFLMSIPVIDFATWTRDASEEHRCAVSTELVKACREVGFAYIVNHGVPQDALEHAFAISKRFYNLPQEEKMKAPHPPGWAHHRGYSWPGLEKVSAVGAKEDDRTLVDQLRSITDCKVIYIPALSCPIRASFAGRSLTPHSGKL
jgi:isopenicillin N synthase-like dioxygenase